MAGAAPDFTGFPDREPEVGYRGHAMLKGFLGVPETKGRVPNPRLYVYRTVSLAAESDDSDAPGRSIFVEIPLTREPHPRSLKKPLSPGAYSVAQVG